MYRLSFRVFFACLFSVLTVSAAQAQLGNSMVTYLSANVGKRLGGGECAHMATEALRANGGEFIKADLGADYPSTGDYVWGNLVTVISYANKKLSDSNPLAVVQPGDIIQYGGSAVIGTSKFGTRHTSVVKTVNAGTSTSGSRPTSVFQQNFNAVRTVQSATIDTTKLTAGWLRIYRPKTRIDATNQYKVTIVNNASTSQTVSIKMGTMNLGTLSLTAANTAGSFLIYTATTDGTVPSLVLSDNVTGIYLQTAKGNNIYNPTTTTVGVQQINP